MGEPSKGWVRLYRKVQDHPRYRDSEFVHVWVELLINATYKPIQRVFRGQEITLRPGQLITGRFAIERQTGVNASKVQRVLKRLKSDHLIDQQGSNACSLITILNWESEQGFDQQSDQRTINQRSASDHSQEGKKSKQLKNADASDSKLLLEALK
jgi:hypothetical protein